MPRTFRRLAVVAAVFAVGFAGYRISASVAARPVVRQQFLRQLDPAVYDLEVETLDFPAGWENPGFDDSRWCFASEFGEASGIGVPDGLRIWSPDVQNHSRVGVRRTFTAAAAGSASLLVSVVRDFAVHFNGELVFEEFDGSCCPARTVDLSDKVVAGENVLAIEGMITAGSSGAIAFELTGGFGAIVSDGTAKVFVFQGRLPFEGSRWAVFSVPGITKSSQITAELTKLSTENCWSVYPELRNGRELSFNVPMAKSAEAMPRGSRIVVKPGQVMVQLTRGIAESRQPLLEPGLYRLIVDTAP